MTRRRLHSFRKRGGKGVIVISRAMKNEEMQRRMDKWV